MSGPVYDHDCRKCRYLGTGRCPTLGEQVGRSGADSVFDFYACSGMKIRGARTFVARYGNRPEEYASGSLFGSAELTTLDLVALYNGLELTSSEEKKLLEVLVRHYKKVLDVPDLVRLASGCSFGSGNVMWKED